MTKDVRPTLEEVRTELDKIESLIATATRLFNDGRMIDLGALARRTHATCDAAIELPTEQGKSLLPDLELILTSLDDLTNQMTERFGALPNLQNEAAPGVAASAYGRLQEPER